MRLIDNLEDMISPCPTNILWVYGGTQPPYDREDLNIQFLKDISAADLTPEALGHQKSLLILVGLVFFHFHDT